MGLTKVGNLTIDAKKKIVYCDRKALKPEEEQDLLAYMSAGYIRKNPVKKTTYTVKSIEKWYMDNEDYDGLEAFKNDMKKDGWISARSSFLEVKKMFEAEQMKKQSVEVLKKMKEDLNEEDKKTIDEAISAMTPQKKKKSAPAEAEVEAEVEE